MHNMNNMQFVQVPRLHHFFDRQAAAARLHHTESADSEASAATDFDTSESKTSESKPVLSAHPPSAGWSAVYSPKRK